MRRRGCDAPRAALACFDAAKADGAHVLGQRGRGGGRSSNGGSSGALPCVRYCQARELVLRPLEGDGLRVGGLTGGTVPTRRAPRYSPPPLPPLLSQAWLAEGGPARRRLNIPPVSLLGPHSVNVDGELTGWSPVRMRVVPRALRVLVPPGLVTTQS